MLDNQALIRYITEKLDGVAGEEYTESQGRIVIRSRSDEDRLEPAA